MYSACYSQKEIITSLFLIEIEYLYNVFNLDPETQQLIK